jgi:hypothetical protein
MNTFVHDALAAGGSISPLVFEDTAFSTAALFNPSVYNDEGTLRVFIRHCQISLFHSEKNIYEHPYGPLVYIHPENDQTLTTKNYLCTLGSDLQLIRHDLVDTSLLDVPPKWEFVGLEDGRLVRWNGVLYACGGRRDTTKNGQGRIEMSGLDVGPDTVKEVARVRLPAPPPNKSYCEKNWMPVIDLPYHFIKWCNPTELVSYNPHACTTQTVYCDESTYTPQLYDFRGGSQVVPLGPDHRVACVHTCDLFKSEAGRKNVKYRHCFVVWNKDWKVVRYTPLFTFLGADVEFCTGLTMFEEDYLLSFGYQDNAAFVLRVPSTVINTICLH